MRIRVAVFLLVCSSSLAFAEPDAAYRFDLSLDLEAMTLRGEGSLRYRNSGSEPMDALPLVLYPARFRSLDPAITDVNFDRFYVRWFDRGDMRLEQVRAGDAPLTVSAGDSTLPDGVSVTVQLPEPLAVGEWVELNVAFLVDIPDRLGSFGHRGGRVVLDGGALPFVPARGAAGRLDPRAPPVPASYDLSLSVRGGDSETRALIGSRVVGAERIVFEGGSPLIVAGGDLASLVGDGDALANSVAGELGLHVVGSEGDDARAAELAKIARSAGAFFRREFLGPDAQLAPLTLIEAPLRDRFVDVADGVVLYSSRLLRIFILLQQFHELEFGRAVILALTQQVLADVPLGSDRDWICEGLAWLVTQEWVKAVKSGIDGDDVRGGTEFLSFVPFFDRLLKSPRFPGSDLFFGRFYEPADALPDSFRRALSRRQRGRVVFEKLRDSLSSEGVLGLVRETLAGGPEVDLRKRVGELTGRDSAPFFDLWLGEKLPKQNLSFGLIEEDGDDLRVEILREGDERVAQVGEPVDVEFDGDEGEVRVRWDGLGARGTVRIPAGAGYWFPSLDIDPDRRTYQAQRGDDTLPRVPVKILVNRFSVRIDLNRGNRNEAAIGLTLHPAHDYAHSVTVDAFYEQDENGVDLGYGYGFGTRRDARSFGAGVGVGLTAATLSEGVLDTDETEGNLASVSAGASFDTRLVEANPTWGFKIGGGVEYTDRLFDTDFRFTRYRGSVSAIYSIIRGTQIAAKVVMGQIEGERVPSQRLFDVGGSGGVRGVETSTFVDTAVFAVRGEVRQMVVEDMDFSLLYLAWLRKIQVVAFMHTGDVGPTIEHIIRRDTEWKWGAGGGVRFYVDAFGVKKFVVSFDVGTRLFDDNGQDPQFYVGAGQSF